jgi:hypothetical protein
MGLIELLQDILKAINTLIQLFLPIFGHISFYPVPNFCFSTWLCTAKKAVPSLRR